ncbi:MAG: hypothetical protein K0R80_1432 [Clostridia bacterium]|jgi:uncharacterized protein (DUF362 family)/Pyruvate/2-oxoacid:ferredoxin oxidoreductase delta subunit|nr:hypothetical protein [Clostridia bacterium]
MNKVHIVKCQEYDLDKVQQAVAECFDAMPEFKEKLFEGAKVLVKTNLLMRKNPEDAVTTHPSVIEAIVRYLQALGCKPVIGDSPGGPYNEWNLKGVYKAAGMNAVAEKTGCELNYDTSVIEVHNEKAKLLKNMQIIKVAHDVDFIISAAKLKTHGMMTYTGAVKNLFGVIPGITKAEYHFKMNNTANFAEHLVDICEYVNPVISIIDAIDCMEGDGPSAGMKKHVGLLMASSSPYALDVAASKVAGINTELIPTIVAAEKRGLINSNYKNLEFSGIDLDEIKVEPFILPSSININFVGGRVPKFLESFITNTFRPQPIFDHDKCVGCEDCKRSCPPDIIKMVNGKPVPDLDKCIRCFCCHELCPIKAVDIKKHWLHERLFR